MNFLKSLDLVEKPIWPIQYLIEKINSDLSAHLTTQWYQVCVDEHTIQSHIRSIANASSNPNISFKERSIEFFKDATIQLIIQNTQWELAGCLFAFEHHDALWIRWLISLEVWGAYTTPNHKRKWIHTILSNNLRRHICENRRQVYAISHDPWIHSKRKDSWWTTIPFTLLKTKYPDIYAALIPWRNASYSLGVSATLADVLDS